MNMQYNIKTKLVDIIKDVRFEVHTAMVRKSSSFLDITPFNPLEIILRNVG
jgi:hypothetical protein